MRYHFFLLVLLCLSSISCTQKTSLSASENSQQTDSAFVLTKKDIVLGAEQPQKYLPLLKNKRVGLIVNHTSVLFNQDSATHLVDFLLQNDIQVTTIFAPEHGFRGKASAGETIKDGKDIKTGLPIISLYGKNKKPKPEQLKDIDVLVFDIQDVGARFYTYISTMHYAMEAAAENDKSFVVLDRPNPNGFYVDGNIRDKKFKSFVGIHPIPIVHGLTVAELAQMIVGENWLETGTDDIKKLDLTTVLCQNYTHKDKYQLPIAPSPNLRSDASIYLYPSLCLFEGTKISVGRGTDTPFEIAGHPDFPDSLAQLTFVPKPNEGAKYPPLEGKKCLGINYRDSTFEYHFSLNPLLSFYKSLQTPEEYFNNYFNTLVGTDSIQKWIKQGWSEEEIRQAWQKDLFDYKKMRKTYLLYPDFE